MSKEKKDKHFIKTPIYDGGPKALKAFIKKNIKFPKKALENKTEGTVYLKYAINHKGKVIDAKIISSLGNGCDEEAIRLVKLLTFIVPKNRGIKIKFFKDIKIHFRLPKKQTKPVAPKQQIQYTYTSSNKKNAPKETSVPIPKKSYSYTIKIGKS